MASVYELRAERREYADKIRSEESAIQNCEREYDSLAEFKRDVERAQESFHEVSSAKNGILESVGAVKANSIAAQHYYDGMKQILDSVGSKIVGVVFSVFVSSIKQKLKKYQRDVERREGKIDYYRQRIEELDQQIAEAERETEEEW